MTHTITPKDFELGPYKEHSFTGPPGEMFMNPNAWYPNGTWNAAINAEGQFQLDALDLVAAGLRILRDQPATGRLCTPGRKSLVMERAYESKTTSGPLAVLSVDEERALVTGYLALFGLQGKDRILPGAFKQTIQEGKTRMAQGRRYLWPMLWQGDPIQPIGGYISAQEDATGLLVTAHLDITTNERGIPNNPLATRVFSGFKRGYVDEQSTLYTVIEKEYDRQGVRNLKACHIVAGAAMALAPER